MSGSYADRVGLGKSNFEWRESQRVTVTGKFQRLRHYKHRQGRNAIRDTFREAFKLIPERYYADTLYLVETSLTGPRGEAMHLNISGRAGKLLADVPTDTIITVEAYFRPWLHNGIGGDLTRIKLRGTGDSENIVPRGHADS